jgi:hypothetical protein
MTHTQRHLLFATVWLYGLPLLFVPLLTLGAVLPNETQMKIWGVIWGLGLMAAFASWALRDVAAHGKPLYWAVIFTAAWFVAFFLAAIPYFLVTRGLRQGATSSLRYLAFVAACFGGWIAIALIHRLISS